MQTESEWWIKLCSKKQYAPQWVQFLPKAPFIKTRCAREWHYNRQTTLTDFAANKRPLVIDYKHGQNHRARKDLEAPAARWIEKLTQRAGAIWRRIRWTKRASEKIKNQEYRFLSSEFTQAEAGKILRLVSTGLANQSAFVMRALSREQPSILPEKQINYTAIANTLTLSPPAEQQEIIAASIRVAKKEFA